MPFKTEHAARQAGPDNFDDFRRTHPDGWPDGLDAIWGIRADGSTAIQSVRADAERWTPDRLREWLAGAGMRAEIEEAVEAAKADEPDLTLPEYMRAALRRGLRAHEEGRTGDGLQPSTVRMARQGAETGRWPADKWVKARAWFRRHRSDWTRGTDTKPGDESPGFAAWLLWADGGDGRGRARVERIAEQIAGPVDKAASPALRPPSRAGDPDRPYVAEIDREHAPNFMVEVPAGHVRSGTDASGERWSVVMPAHYGDIDGTVGADGDPIDVFVGPDLDAEMVYVVAIANPDGSYGEDKVLFGFPSYAEAMRAFGDAYDRDDMILEVRAADRWGFAWWLAEHGRMGHAFREPMQPGAARSPGIVIKARHTVPLAHDPARALIKFLTQIAQGVEMATGNRLTNIDVEEVSPVDRPANGKTFALVKNADGESVPVDAPAEKAAEGEPAGQPVETEKKIIGADAPADAVEKAADDATPEPTEKADADPPAVEMEKAEGPTTPPTDPGGPVEKMEHGDERMMKAAAGLLHYAGGDMRKAMGALAGVDDSMMKAAADEMKASADPMVEIARSLGRIADQMGMSKGSVEKAAPAAPVDIAAEVEKAVGGRLDALAGRLSAVEGQPARPNGAGGGESVQKGSQPGGWPSRFA